MEKNRLVRNEDEDGRNSSSWICAASSTMSSSSSSSSFSPDSDGCWTRDRESSRSIDRTERRHHSLVHAFWLKTGREKTRKIFPFDRSTTQSNIAAQDVSGSQIQGSWILKNIEEKSLILLRLMSCSSIHLIHRLDPVKTFLSFETEYSSREWKDTKKREERKKEQHIWNLTLGFLISSVSDSYANQALNNETDFLHPMTMMLGDIYGRAIDSPNERRDSIEHSFFHPCVICRQVTQIHFDYINFFSYDPHLHWWRTSASLSSFSLSLRFIADKKRNCTLDVEADSATEHLTPFMNLSHPWVNKFSPWSDTLVWLFSPRHDGKSVGQGVRLLESFSCGMKIKGLISLKHQLCGSSLRRS